MTDKDQQAAIDKQLKESQEKTEKRMAAQQHAAGEAQPTPTQEENDRAMLGQHVDPKEPDGSQEQPPVGDPTHQPATTRSLGAQGAGGYQTRAARPAASTERKE